MNHETFLLLNFCSRRYVFVIINTLLEDSSANINNDQMQMRSPVKIQKINFRLSTAIISGYRFKAIEVRLFFLAILFYSPVMLPVL